MESRDMTLNMGKSLVNDLGIFDINTRVGTFEHDGLTVKLDCSNGEDEHIKLTLHGKHVAEGPLLSEGMWRGAENDNSGLLPIAHDIFNQYPNPSMYSQRFYQD